MIHHLRAIRDPAPIILGKSRPPRLNENEKRLVKTIDILCRSRPSGRSGGNGPRSKAMPKTEIRNWKSVVERMSGSCSRISHISR
jgi:hypothetical protein